MDEAHYVYAVVARDTPLPPHLTGLRGDPLVLVPCDDLAAVISRVEAYSLERSIENVVLHEQIVEAIRQSAPALPVRFGTILPDVTSVEDALRRRMETLAADLHRLGDKLEYGLNALWTVPNQDDVTQVEGLEQPEPSTGSEGRGTAYLRARVEETRREQNRRARAQPLVEHLSATLGACALEHRQTLLPTARLAVRAAYLVEPPKDGVFKEAFEAVRASHPAFRFLLTGPWPPYSFVTHDESGGLLTGLRGGE